MQGVSLDNIAHLRCRKLKCIDREPPYGSEVEKEDANEQ